MSTFAESDRIRTACGSSSTRLARLLDAFLCALPLPLAAQEQRVFSSPVEAATALFAAVKSDDTAAPRIYSRSRFPAAAFLGRCGRGQEFAGTVRQRVGSNAQARLRRSGSGDYLPGLRQLARTDSDCQEDNGWVFDTAAGKHELIYRRIGRNEIYTMRVLENLASAQREYESEDHDGHQFARYILSDPGKQDGLYWETAEGSSPSPIGPLIPDATTQGYKVQKHEENAIVAPFHGYFYRVLSSQGKNAPGGAKNYIVDGKMTGGFAFLAWPAEYRSSGVMTFMINQDSVIVQKDLGPDTASIAKGMSVFNPDSTWEQVGQ